jgi:hypothetical protein
MAARNAAVRAFPAANTIEFRYLNRNLMVPQFHLLTLTFDSNSRKAENVSFCAQ